MRPPGASGFWVKTHHFTTMTDNQKKFYFREWGKARKVLRENGFSPAEADAERAQIHQDNDLPDSSKDFNKTTHLDAFIKACRAITGQTSIDIQDQERKRLIHLIKATGHPDAYLNKLARDKHHGDHWQALPPVPLKHLLFTARNRACANEKCPSTD